MFTVSFTYRQVFKHRYCLFLYHSNYISQTQSSYQSISKLYSNQTTSVRHSYHTSLPANYTAIKLHQSDIVIIPVYQQTIQQSNYISQTQSSYQSTSKLYSNQITSVRNSHHTSLPANYTAIKLHQSDIVIIPVYQQTIQQSKPNDYISQAQSSYQSTSKLYSNQITSVGHSHHTSLPANYTAIKT